MDIWQIATGDTGRNFSSLFFEYDIMFLGPCHPGDAVINQEAYRGRANSQEQQVYSFAHKPNPGDIVLMRFGKEVIGIGVIPEGEQDQYAFDEIFKCVYGWDLRHTRRVKWFPVESDDPLRHVFREVKQKPAFSGVKEERIINLVRSHPIPPESVALNDLPKVDTQDFKEDELGRALFQKGISNKNIEDIMGALNQADRLLSWYMSSPNEGRPTEHEIVSHILLPLLLGLGWSHQQIGVEWRKIDVALFQAAPTATENCVIVIEAKGLGQGLNHVLDQPSRYVRENTLTHVKKIIVTDGANIFVYQVDNLEVDSQPIGYISINNLQKKYLIPRNTDLVDTLYMLQPSQN